MSAIITIKGLSKFYRVGAEKVRALSNINLEIHKGEICCILGTSGSGKSTLLNQLAGLEKPTSGSVYIGKTNISKLTEDQLAGFRQRNVGFVFQSYNLLSSMTAAENVAMPLLFRGVDKIVREREAAAMLKKVGLANRMRHRPSEMSGGQQQRVGIARAFVAKPKIVFADEPTGNLDSRTTLEVMRLLIEMAHTHGITFVLVTHDNELARYADRIVTIKDGLIISDKVNENPAYLESLEDAQNRFDAAASSEPITKSLPIHVAKPPTESATESPVEQPATEQAPETGETPTKLPTESPVGGVSKVDLPQPPTLVEDVPKVLPPPTLEEAVEQTPTPLIPTKEKYSQKLLGKIKGELSKLSKRPPATSLPPEGENHEETANSSTEEKGEVKH